MPALVLFAMYSGMASAQRTNPPPDPLLNERITPPVNVAAAGDLSRCLVVNVNAQPRTVHTQLMRFDGRISEDFGNITLQPGTSYGAGQLSWRLLLLQVHRDRWNPRRHPRLPLGLHQHRMQADDLCGVT